MTLPVWAGPLELELDPKRTTVSFVLGATMHKVRGTFALDRGRVVYDPATGAASGEIVVDARTGDSDNKKRDRDMHDKVLESERFPEIVLSVERVEGELPTAGEGRLTVFGTMSLHGDGHPVDFPVSVIADGAGLKIAAEFEVPYVEWGLKDPSKLLLRVAKQVTVGVEAEATISGR
jgi:polyisoprenoid-binding protein YceI